MTLLSVGLFCDNDQTDSPLNSVQYQYIFCTKHYFLTFILTIKHVLFNLYCCQEGIKAIRLTVIEWNYSCQNPARIIPFSYCDVKRGTTVVVIFLIHDFFFLIHGVTLKAYLSQCVSYYTQNWLNISGCVCMCVHIVLLVFWFT